MYVYFAEESYLDFRSDCGKGQTIILEKDS